MDDGLEGAPPGTSPSSATGVAAAPGAVPGARDGQAAETAVRTPSSGPPSAATSAPRDGRSEDGPSDVDRPTTVTPTVTDGPVAGAPATDASGAGAGAPTDVTGADPSRGDGPRAEGSRAEGSRAEGPRAGARDGTPQEGTSPADGTVRLPPAPGPAQPSARAGGSRARSRLDGPTTHLPGVRGGARPDTSDAGAPTAVTPATRSTPPSRPASGRSTGRRGGFERRDPRSSRGGEPLPGTMIVDRYRLVAEVGRDDRAGAALWKGRDVMLERDVAVTLLTGGWQADARASSALSRATRSAHFEHAHAARVLDVVAPGSGRLPGGILGAAVAEWTPGRDLVELVSRGPLRPSEALRVIEPLAAAVAEAHRSGLVLGLEDPRRVRVGARASARLAFGMPRGDATVDDDVHGLGAMLYLLLTARWPAADGRAPAGLQAAPRTEGGAAVPARRLRPDLPLDLAALVDRTLDADGGIRTAAAVHRLAAGLRERSEDDGVLLPVTEDGASLDEDPSAVWHDDDSEPTRDPATRRKLRIGLTLLVLATLAIVAFVAFQLVSLVSGGSSSAPPLVIPAAPTASASPTASAAAPAAPAPAPATAPAPGAPVQLASVAVYDPSGGPDNPTRVNRAVDGDPTTAWSTNAYRQQLPALKPGIGVMATFTAPSGVSAVTVRSPSPGTRLEIRSAPAADVPLSQTQVLGAGIVVGDSVTIPLQAAPPTGNLLIWITALGQDGGQFSTDLAEVTVQRAG